MKSKQKYLSLLMLQPRAWIIESMSNQSEYMSNTHIALHKIALRKKIDD